MVNEGLIALMLDVTAMGGVVRLATIMGAVYSYG
jgi:hypothetical protein